MAGGKPLFVLLAAGTGLFSFGCSGNGAGGSPVSATITAPTTPVPVSTPLPPGGSGAPSLPELKSATYVGFEGWKDPITLVNGRWENTAPQQALIFGRDFRAVGDIDGDGVPEAAVVLTQNAGGSGTVDYLAVVKRKESKLHNVATTRLGSSVQVRSARIEAGRVVVTAVHPGESDAPCCPGEVVEWSFPFADGKLGPPKVEGKPSRLSLDTVAGSEWVLRFWDESEAAPAEPAVTLAYEGGRFGGSSGCNRYSAPATAGAQPGDVAVGPAAGTKEACPEPQSAVETRFLQSLGAGTKYGFLLGQLAVRYPKPNGGAGVLLFEARPAAPATAQ